MEQSGFTFFLRTFGCQMNVADNAGIGSRLRAHGGVEVAAADQAELVLVNTCTVRKKAEDKALSYFGELRQLKAKANPPFIVAMGCAIPIARGLITARAPHLDLLIDYSDPDLVFAELAGRFPPLAGTVLAGGFSPLATAGRARLNFVTAIRGCNHGCSYCIVPQARGPQRDVPLAQIVAEARQFEAAGAPDICVLGQNILAYGAVSGPGHPGFIELIEELLRQTSFRWVTYLTSRPGDLTDEICERVIAHPRVTPLLHLPVQSGSDRVLAAMRRGYDQAHYRRIVARARACRPDLYVTTDLLVGFPTETEQDFQETMQLVEEVGFDDAFMFAYSPRPGTPAAELYSDSLPRPAKLDRLRHLIERQRAIGAARNRRYLEQELEVIVEEQSGSGATARTAFNKPVHLAHCRSAVGQYTRVRITGVRVSSFSGEEVE